MQRTSGTISRLILVIIAALVLGLWPNHAAAGGSATTVNGRGAAVMTDPTTGKEYPLDFRIAGTVAADGATQGRINVVFRGSYAQEFGADRIHLTGKIEQGSVAADGTVVLKGTLLDHENKQGEGQTWKSYEPFRITAGGSLGTDKFLLFWCTLPEYQVQVTDGSLQIHYGSSSQMFSARGGLSMASAGSRSC